MKSVKKVASRFGDKFKQISGKFNFEFIFRNVIANAVIVAVILVAFMCSGFSSGQRTVQVSNSEYKGTIFAGDKQSKKVSLMVNVYWGNEYLIKMLEIFKEHNVKTTFFIGGSWAEKNIELLKRIYADGHEIASHGYSHMDQGKFGYQENFEEINKCHLIIKDILKLEMNLFAPPSGSYNSSTIKVAETLGYKTIMWTRDTIDWRDQDENLIYSRAVTGVSGGDLILMHPTKCTSNALAKIIESINSNGFEVAKVSEVIC